MKGKGKTQPLALLRRLALALPSAVETVTFGHPTFQAGKKTFAVFERYRDRDRICFKATLSEQAFLTLDPRFIAAPYIGKHGWTCLDVDDGAELDELKELVETSYRLVATKAMLRELDAPRPKPRKAK